MVEGGYIIKLENVPKDWINCGNGLWRKPIEYCQNGKIYKSTRKYHEKKCINCSEMYLADSSNKTARFCGLHCAGTGRFGSQWKGGKQKYGGYIYIWKPEHPNANKRGYVAEHILIMTQVLKRPLEKPETIHHINGIRDDNRKENLIVMKRGEHLKKYHAKNAGIISGKARRGKFRKTWDREAENGSRALC